MSKLLAVTLASFVPLAATAGERLHVIEHAVNETTTHVAAGAKSDSVADLLTFANPVFDATNKTQLGTDQGYCVRIVVGKSWECFWTLTLKEGQITVEGPYSDAGDSILAVTGGTGRYAGAKGQLTLNPRNEKHSTYLFIYELL